MNGLKKLENVFINIMGIEYETIISMKQLLEAIKAKYLCLHDWEVIYRVEYIDGWKILLKCKKCGKLRKKIV